MIDKHEQIKDIFNKFNIRNNYLILEYNKNKNTIIKLKYYNTKLVSYAEFIINKDNSDALLAHGIHKRWDKITHKLIDYSEWKNGYFVKSFLP